MASANKPSLDEYKSQLMKEVGNNPIFTSETVYNSYMNGLAADIKGQAYAEAVREMAKFKEAYVKPDYLFLADPSDSTLRHKPLDSVINKIYRLNVLKPKSWPPSDISNLISLGDCHNRLDDLFRTKFICRYLDGPRFVCDKLKEFCQNKNIEFKCRDVTTSLGYHAWHFYYKQEIDDFAGLGKSEVFVELQFTTQLAEVISSLTHSHYEEIRMGGKPDDGWRWDVSSDRFRPYYISHGLHLLEGIILEFRDSVINAEESEKNG